MAHFASGILHRIDNVLVAGAPAQIAFQSVADFVISRRGVALEELIARHDHAGRAEPALQTVLFPKALLGGIEITILSQALNGGNFCPVRLYR